jgi:hypothetical protein
VFIYKKNKKGGKMPSKSNKEFNDLVKCVKLRKASYTLMEKAEDELKKIATNLLSLVPPELEDFACEKFDNTYNMKEFVRQLLYLEGEGLCYLSKIKNSKEYGFKDNEDAISKLNDLKKAWADIIYVKIIPPKEDEDNYIKVYYNLI